MKDREKGFTLIELLAVIIILALIMAICIPSIIGIINKSKKETFYLYAQSLYSKAVAAYTQGQNSDDQDSFECVMYDIETDLDISNTGNYEGWAQVSRQAVLSEKKSASITLGDGTSEIQYVKYCVDDGECTPSKTYAFSEGSTQVQVTKTINSDQVLCASYQIASGDTLVAGATDSEGGTDPICKTYGDADEIISSYDYSVLLTIKSGEYAVDKFDMNESTSEDEFYEAVDNFETESDDANKIVIASPVCSGDVVTLKGDVDEDTTTIIAARTTTTADSNCPTVSDTNFNIILDANGGTVSGDNTISYCSGCSDSTIPTPVRDGYVFSGWYYDKSYTNRLSSNSTKYITFSYSRDSQGCVASYNDVYLYAKWAIDASKTSTTTKGVAVYSVTTKESNGTTKYTTTAKGNNGTTKYETTTKGSNGTAKYTTTAKGNNGTTKYETTSKGSNGTASYTTTSKGSNGTTKYETTTKGSNGTASYTTTSKGSNGTASYSTSTTTGKGSASYTTTSKTTRETTNYTTTTRDTSDTSLLLASLSVSGYNIGFNSVKFYYDLDVPYTTESLSITAVAQEPATTTVTIIGQDDLAVGDNVIVIRLTNTVTGATGDYHIMVSRYDAGGQKVTQQTTTVYNSDNEEGLPDPELEESDASLSSLTVGGYTLDFDPNVYDYVLDVRDLNDLLLSYKTSSDNATVTIEGNDSLNNGDEVTLHVKSQNNYYTKDYTIKINYTEGASSTTKYLRKILIVLFIVLGIVVILNVISRKHNISIIKKATRTPKNP